MDEMSDTRQLLASRIEQKQQAVRSYLGRERPRRNRLSNISVMGSALAATLTAGPAFGGTGFTNALQGVFSLSTDSIVWRVLCLAAVLLSISSALATNFANSHLIADKVSAAETVNAQLEGLRDALSFGQISTEDALKLYQQYIARVAFVDAAPSRGMPAACSADPARGGHNAGHHRGRGNSTSALPPWPVDPQRTVARFTPSGFGCFPAAAGVFWAKIRVDPGACYAKAPRTADLCRVPRTCNVF